MTTTITPPTIRILDNPPAPGTEEWQRTISASKVPSMIRNADGTWAGIGYMTAWEQFEQIKGRHAETHNKFMLDKMDRAHAAEKGIAEFWVRQQDNPQDWTLSDGEVTFHNTALGTDEYPVIATIDYVATNTATGERVGIECKNPINSGLRPNWWFQTVTQSLVANLDRHVLVINPDKGLPQVHHIPKDDPAHDKVRADIDNFIARLEADDAPDPDTYVLDDETIAEIEQAKADVADAQARLTELKQQAIRKMGSYKQATHGEKVIITRAPGRFSQSRLPKDLQKIAKDDRFKTISAKFDEKKFAAEYPEAYAEAVADETIKFL